LERIAEFVGNAGGQSAEPEDSFSTQWIIIRFAMNGAWVYGWFMAWAWVL
jgi:hypothetical protein